MGHYVDIPAKILEGEMGQVTMILAPSADYLPTDTWTLSPAFHQRWIYVWGRRVKSFCPGWALQVRNGKKAWIRVDKRQLRLF